MRVLIVDDHPIMCGGVRACLYDFDHAPEVLEAASLADTVRIAGTPAARDACAMGYIPRGSAPAVLQGALRLVPANGIHVPPAVPGFSGAPRAEVPVDPGPRRGHAMEVAPAAEGD